MYIFIWDFLHTKIKTSNPNKYRYTLNINKSIPVMIKTTVLRKKH